MTLMLENRFAADSKNGIIVAVCLALLSLHLVEIVIDIFSSILFSQVSCVSIVARLTLQTDTAYPPEVPALKTLNQK